MSPPLLQIDLAKVEANARSLVTRLGQRRIAVVGATKALLGAPEIGAVLQRAGAAGVGDSRVQNLARLRAAGSTLPRTLLRSPMLSEVDTVVSEAHRSLNTGIGVIRALEASARRQGTTHGVVLMVELGDLREGIASSDVVALGCSVERLVGVELLGLGTNLACQSGIAPDQSKMDELSELVDSLEATIGRSLAVVSGGNSANIGWALSTTDVGRVNELRLGESILLGTEPLRRTTVVGLHADACVVLAEVIEVATKPSQPWGSSGQAAFGVPPTRQDLGFRRQALVAIGHQDVDPLGLTPPPGCVILGASSDHLVLDVTEGEVNVGDELAFAPNYSALLRAATSPFVTKCFLTPPPSGHRDLVLGRSARLMDGQIARERGTP